MASPSIHRRPAHVAQIAAQIGLFGCSAYFVCKRQIVADAEGNLVHVVIHPADVQNSDGAPIVLAEIIRRHSWLSHILTDGGYACDTLRRVPRKIGKQTVRIIMRSNRVTGFEVLPGRWVVERTLARLGRNRGPAKD